MFWIYESRNVVLENQKPKHQERYKWAFINFMKSIPNDCQLFSIFEDAYVYKLIETTTTKYYGDTPVVQKSEYKYKTESGNPNILQPGCYYPMSVTTTDDCGILTTSYSYNYSFKALCSSEILNKEVGQSIDTDVSYYGSTARPYFISKRVTSGGRPKTIYELRASYLDKFGNFCHIKETGQPNKVIIWGYKGAYPVAEIVNADYDKVVGWLTQSSIDYIGDATSMSEYYINLLNSLRKKLPEALVTTYTYIPLVGVSSITDPAGRVQLFRYDGAGRLAAVCDEGGNLLETNEYAAKTI